MTTQETPPEPLRPAKWPDLLGHTTLIDGVVVDLPIGEDDEDEGEQQ